MTDQEGYVYTEDELLLSNTALVSLIREVLSKDKDFRFCASGSSMYPFIKNGDLINISSLKTSRVKLGDVVAYVRSDTEKLVVHRVVGIERDAYLIQGDNAVGDITDIIMEDRILGKVSKVEWNGKVIRLGLGLEKGVIARFSRRQLLRPLLQRLGPVIRPFRRVLP